MTDYRYFFDDQPFEVDAFSHMFSAIAVANVEAGQASDGDPVAVRQKVDATIASQLELILPQMPRDSLAGLAEALPDALRHPRFGPSWFAVREQAAHWSPVMSVAGDVQVAIVLAGLGIPSLPLPRSPAPFDFSGRPSLDVNELVALFAKGPDTLVGFEPASQDLYFLVSESAHSLRRCLKRNPVSSDTPRDGSQTG